MWQKIFQIETKCAELSLKLGKNSKNETWWCLWRIRPIISVSISANHGGRLSTGPAWAAGAHTHLSCSTWVRLWNCQLHIITVISVRWAKTCQSKTHESWHIKRFGSLKHNLPSKPWLATLLVNVWYGMRERISLEWCDRSSEIWGLDSRVRCRVETNSILQCQLNRFSKQDAEL